MWKNMYGVRKIYNIKANNINNFKFKISNYIPITDLKEYKKIIYAIPKTINLCSVSMGYELSVKKISDLSYGDAEYDVGILEDTVGEKFDVLQGIKSEYWVNKTYNITIPKNTYAFIFSCSIAGGKGGGSIEIIVDGKNYGRYYANAYEGKDVFIDVSKIDSTKQHNVSVICRNICYDGKLCIQKRLVKKSINSDIEIFVILYKEG